MSSSRCCDSILHSLSRLMSEAPYYILTKYSFLVVAICSRHMHQMIAHVWWENIYFHTEMTARSQSLATIRGLKIPCQVDPGARRRSHQDLKNLLLYCIIFIYNVFIQMKQGFHQLLRLFWFAELSLYTCKVSLDEDPALMLCRLLLN